MGSSLVAVFSATPAAARPNDDAAPVAVASTRTWASFAAREIGSRHSQLGRIQAALRDLTGAERLVQLGSMSGSTESGPYLSPKQFTARFVASQLGERLPPIDAVAPNPTAIADGAAKAGREPVPIAAGREKAAGVFALLRMIDPCALHDVAAAVRVTADTPDQVVPGESLAVCTLRLNHATIAPSWSFAVRVGTRYPGRVRELAEQETIAGKVFYRSGSRTRTDTVCTYTRPIGADWGISLTVHPPTNNWEQRSTCTVARRYLIMSAPRWADLPLRGEKLTAPQLPLAGLDPCGNAPTVLRTLQVLGSADPVDLFICRIGTPPNRNGILDIQVTIEYTAGPDPTAPGTPGDLSQWLAAIGGRAGIVNPVSTALCQVSVPIDSPVAIPFENTRIVQLLRVDAKSCALATAAAETALNSIGTP